MDRYFEVPLSEYCAGSDILVYRPASLNNPKDNSVMFLTEGYVQYAEKLSQCKDCLVFWPKAIDVPNYVRDRHVVSLCDNPHNEFCRFFVSHNITNLPKRHEFEIIDGSLIEKGAVIGKNCTIFPGCYIGNEVSVGNNVFIGTGVKLVGRIKIGNNVVIRENSVIGADGLTTDRDVDGKALTMPQFGGVIIEDDVQIGALTVIGRGAIDNTIIKRGSKIDNSTFISHNVVLGEDTFVVGETIMFGSSSTGNQVLISGNSTIRDGRHIGSMARVGMGSVVTRDVEDGMTVKGNPAK